MTTLRIYVASGFETRERLVPIRDMIEKIRSRDLKRMKIKDLGEPNVDGSPAGLIDVLHRMCLFREKGDTDAMVEFLTRSGQGKNPALWLVAQAVSEILPDGDKEKQLMQGLLNQREKLEQEQGRLF